MSRPLSMLLLSHVPDDPDAGASRVYHLLGDELRARGHRVEVHHADQMGLPADPRLRKLATRVALPQYVSRHGMRVGPWFHDVVMGSAGTTAPLFRRLRGRHARPALVNHVHGLAVFSHLANRDEHTLGHARASVLNQLVTGPVQMRWDVAGAHAADLTVVQNTRDLAEVRGWVGRGRAELMPAAVHPDLLAASADVPDPAQRRRGDVVWFGTWEARKGAPYVPGAFRRLRARHPDATLTVGGTGRPEAEIREQFAPQDREHVTVLPRVSREEQAAVYARASVVLFPSLSEGFGLAVVEAMCFGAAAVTTSTGVGGDALREGTDARVVPPSTEHLGDALADLVGDDEARAQIARTGRDLARSFTVQRQADRFEELVRPLVEAREAAGLGPVAAHEAAGLGPAELRPEGQEVRHG